MNIRLTVTVLIATLGVAVSVVLACTDDRPVATQAGWPTPSTKATSVFPSKPSATETMTPEGTSRTESTPTKKPNPDWTPTPNAGPTSTSGTAPTPATKPDNTPSPTFTPTPSPTPTPGPKPKPTPRPTSTPLPRPTPTPVPTPGPAPSTAFPVSQLTDIVALFPTLSPDGTKIAFESDRDGDWDIFVMDSDGNNVKRLTNHSATDQSAAWSPDGTKIAFQSNRGDNWDIYIMDSDGANVTRLTDHVAQDGFPSWSPDGAKIAFNSDRDGDWDIFVMDTDGNGVTRLTDHRARDFNPKWSPDGTKIAFTSERDGNTNIFVMGSDGANVTRLTDHIAGDSDPAWSPDGTRIAFASDRFGDYDIYAMDSDGANVTRLTDRIVDDVNPTWSQDGTTIVLASNAGGDFGLHVANVQSLGVGPAQSTTTLVQTPSPTPTFTPTPTETPTQTPTPTPTPAPFNVTQITQMRGAASPQWSPDGSKIAFYNTSGIYTVNADGSQVSQITLGAPSSDLRWSPDGSRIAFTSTSDGNDEVYVVNSDGSRLNQITHHNCVWGAGEVEWSPNGQWIAYRFLRRWNHECDENWKLDSALISSIRSDGSLVQERTGRIGASNPAWSPDGSRIAFNTDSGVYTVHADGGGIYQISQAGRVPLWSPDGSRIAFNADNGVYTVNADGSQLTQVSPEETRFLSWSPDGSRIAFLGEDRNIYVVNADGARLTQITHNGNSWYPDWSPDGTRIAFTCGRGDGSWHVCVVDVESLGVGPSARLPTPTPSPTPSPTPTPAPTHPPTPSTPTPPAVLSPTPTVASTPSPTFNVTQLTHRDGYDTVWSLDGTKIAFSSLQNQNTDIYIMDADGSNVTRITELAGIDYHAAWSPDGTNIAFANGGVIYLVNADGTNVSAIARTDQNESPTWSPNGTKIAFASDRDGDWDIFVMDTDGANVTRLTDTSANDKSPAWAPDGTKIVFKSAGGDGDYGIYVMDSDGANITRISDSITDWASPSWAPDGTRITYNTAGDAGNRRVYLADVSSLGVGSAAAVVLPTPVPTPTPTADDRAVLTALYRATNGDNWLDNENWLSNLPLNQWFGVRANADNRVNVLELFDNRLRGELPEQIGELTELTYLDLSANSLTGDLPASTGNLRNIEVLLLSENDLTGCAPASLRSASISDIVFTPLGYCDEPPKQMPTTPSFVKWSIGDTVRQSEERAVRIGVQWLHDYAEEHEWPMSGGDVTVYFDTTRGLVSACTKRWPLFILKCRELQSGQLAGFANSQANFIKASERDQPHYIGSLYAIAGTAIHENLHTSFQHQVHGFNVTRGFWEFPSPTWLTEGMATYFAAVIANIHLPGLSLSSEGWFEDLRESWVKRALSTSNALANSESETGCSYQCGPLAVELLASRAGLRAMPDFHLALRRTWLEVLLKDIWWDDPNAWHDPFEETFGMTVPEFYQLYEQHKAAGFPALDPPQVVQ